MNRIQAKHQNEHLLSMWDNKHPRKSMKNIISKNPHVTIHHNNEAGKWQWSIALTGTDLWLTSFSKQEKAKDFVTNHGLEHDVIDSRPAFEKRWGMDK